MAENMNLITGYQGVPHVTSADDGVINAAIFGKGSYILDIGEKFRAEIVTNNQVRVYDGAASIQGRVARIEASTYVDLTIVNGSQGMKRNDLICIRYEKDADTLVETANLVVIKGTESAGTATDPSYTEGDILNGDLVAEYPIYRVELDGLSIDNIVELGTPVRNLDEVVPIKKGGTGVTSLSDLREAVGLDNVKVKFVNIARNSSVQTKCKHAIVFAFMTANIYGIFGCWGSNVYQLEGGSGVSDIAVNPYTTGSASGFTVQNMRGDGSLRAFIMYSE